jgi:putative Ca2+/H+ antiporter (TMEM165/GDT1 family)
MINAAAAAFGIVFLAEFGDKTQLVALGLGARYRLATVLAGITAAYAVTMAISVLGGALLGATLPERAIALGGGLAFLGFALWTLVDRDGDDDGDDGDDDDAAIRRTAARTGRGALFSVIAAMVIAELGDKTMLATATLAAREYPLAVWIGGTLGITASGAIAVIVGRSLGDRLPRHAIRIGAAALFAVFGLWLLSEAIGG